jgi:Leucine-rich repeat (LRR) protein
MNSNLISLLYLLTPKTKLLKFDNYFWKLILIKYFKDNYKKSKNYILEYKKNYDLDKIIKIFDYDCDNNDLKQITEIFSDHNDGYFLTKFPTELALLTNLKSIEICQNIKYIPSNISLLINLENFLINYSQIKTIPTKIGLLTNLKNLYLGFNKLKFIPSNIGFLVNLIVFSVRNNRLKNLPSQINLLGKLEKVFIINNKVKLDYIFSEKIDFLLL